MNYSYSYKKVVSKYHDTKKLTRPHHFGQKELRMLHDITYMNLFIKTWCGQAVHILPYKPMHTHLTLSTFLVD